MAAVKMTFSISDDLAHRFVREVPARRRSQFVAEALERRLAAEEAALVRACQLANGDLDVTALECELREEPPE